MSFYRCSGGGKRSLAEIAFCGYLGNYTLEGTNAIYTVDTDTLQFGYATKHGGTNFEVTGKYIELVRATCTILVGGTYHVRYNNGSSYGETTKTFNAGESFILSRGADVGIIWKVTGE